MTYNVFGGTLNPTLLYYSTVSIGRFVIKNEAAIAKRGAIALARSATCPIYGS